MAPNEKIFENIELKMMATKPFAAQFWGTIKVYVWNG
jgi:hypothetical protein